MDDLIKVNNQEGILVVSSREVARSFDKSHYHVVEAISSKIKNLTHEKSGVEISHLFIEREFEHRGNFYKEYLLTRDGFSFIAMGFTGAKADLWKLKYIEAFNKMEQELLAPKKLSPMEQLKLQYEVLDEHDERITNLENNMTIDYGQQLELQNLARARVISILGGTNSPSYKEKSLRDRVFPSIWRDYKDYFNINSYKNTSRKDLGKATKFLERWHPQGKLLREIEEINNQLAI